MALPTALEGISRSQGASFTQETRAQNEIFTLSQILGEDAKPILEAAAQDLAAIALGNATSDIEDYTQLASNPNHPAWQFVKQLGFDPQTMNADMIRQSIETFNKELSTQISELTSRKRALEQESDTAIAIRELMPLMLGIGMIAPEMSAKVMPMLIAMAPKIKQNALRKIEEKINILQQESMEQNLRASNIISQMENRRTAAGRLAISFVQEARRARVDSLRTRVRAIGQLMDTWMGSERLKMQAKTQGRLAVSQLMRGIQDYENLVWRTILQIPDYPDPNQAARARLNLLETLNERRLKLRETLRNMRADLQAQGDTQGVQTVDLYMAIVQPYSADDLQLMAQQARNTTAALAADRVRYMQAASVAFLARASLDNARELTETLFSVAGGPRVVDMLLKSGQDFNSTTFEEFKRSLEAAGTFEAARRAFEPYAAQGAALAHGVRKMGESSITGARQTGRTGLIPDIQTQTNLAIQSIETQLANAANQTVQRMYQKAYGTPLTTQAPTTLDEVVRTIDDLKRQRAQDRNFTEQLDALKEEITKTKQILEESKLP